MRIMHLLILMSLITVLAACGGDGDPEPSPTPTETATLTASPVPTSTNTPTATATITPAPTEPEPEVTEEEASLTDALTFSLMMEQVLQDGALDPPITLELPEEWQQFNGTQPITDLDGELVIIPYTVYFGPVTGGTGQIILMWGFRSVAPSGNPLISEGSQVSLWADGLRLMRLGLFDPQCNIGSDVERTFRVAGEPAIGTLYSAVDCPDVPDTRGWFAGVERQSINFMFFMSGDPIEVMDGDAPQQMQNILDTVEFRIDEFLANTP